MERLSPNVPPIPMTVINFSLFVEISEAGTKLILLCEPNEDWTEYNFGLFNGCFVLLC